MTFTIMGELTPDAERLVLFGVGEPEYVAQAAKVLHLLTPQIKKTDPPGALELPATWAAVVQLSHEFGPAWTPGPRLTEWIGEQVRARTELGPDLIVGGLAAHAGLRPRPYQEDGARMIAATGKTLITDEPGTGKTITTILGLTQRAALTRDAPLPVLVVCPASVVDAWVQAWADWYPAWRALAYRGTPKQRRALIAAGAEGGHPRVEVFVASYDTARRDAAPGPGPLLDLGARSLVIDETHMIKTPSAERSKAVRRLARSAENVVALSGTPITHHPGDLWPTLASIEPAAWPSRDRWVKRYCLSIPGEYGEQIVGLNKATEAEFRTTLLGQHRRIAKADVLDQLPPKVHSVRTVELPREWRKVYDDFETSMLAELPDGGELSVMDVLSQLTHLTALSSAAGDVEVTYGPDEDEYGEPKKHVHVRLRAPSWKADALLEILAERPSEPVVAFASSRQLVTLAGQAATDAGYSVGYIVGGQTARERTATIEAFQAGKLDLIAVTTQAGGVGITLTASRTAVFLQRPWSFVDAVQAEDRLHRIGAERHESIEVIDIVAQSTVDTRIRSVLRDKARQLSELVQDPRIVSELLGGSTKIKKEAA